METHSRRSFIVLALGLGLALACLWMWGGSARPIARAQPEAAIFRVATTGADLPGCGTVISPCLTVQYAVDQAAIGDEVHVAEGTYAGVQVKPAPAWYPGPAVVTQVVYISKSVTVRGGYTTGNGFAGPPDPVANPTILDAQGEGRVILILGDPFVAPSLAITPTVEGFHLYDGNAAGLGGNQPNPPFPPVYDAAGGVGIIAANVVVSGCHVFSNTAFTAGGIGVGYAGAGLIGNLIEANSADYDGGGVGLSASTVTLLGNTIIANISGHDGAGIATTGCDDLTLIANSVMSNTAYAGGAGLYMDTTTATLSLNAFISNTAVDVHGGEGGGGVYLWESRAEINRTVILSNTATWFGGGVYLGSHSDAALTNCIVAANRADVVGGGFFVEDSAVRLLHCTVADNFGGDGSGLFVSDYIYPGAGTAAMTNTILAGHTVGLTVTAGSTATLETTLWYGNAINTGGPGAVFTSTDHFGNPLFVDPAGHDYHIGPGSAAMDAALDVGLAVDFDGDGRPLDGDLDGTVLPDIGADEFCPRVDIFLPIVWRN